METIAWNDFERVELRVGTVIRVEPFPEAHKPSLKVWVDFGSGIGVKKTSARIAALYSESTLMGRQVVGVVNFPPRQIGPFMSEFLLTGFTREDEAVVLIMPERAVPNGAKLM